MDRVVAVLSWPNYIVLLYKWVKTSWTYSTMNSCTACRYVGYSFVYCAWYAFPFEALEVFTIFFLQVECRVFSIPCSRKESRLLGFGQAIADTRTFVCCQSYRAGLGATVWQGCGSGSSNSRYGSAAKITNIQLKSFISHSNVYFLWKNYFEHSRKSSKNIRTSLNPNP